jgi:cysteine desulfurase
MKTDTDVKRLGVDMMSVSGHKIHGPKGIGALFVSRDIEAGPIMFGGGQERGLRPSTENVPGIVGLGKACEVAMSTMSSDVKRMEGIRDRRRGEVLETEGSVLNGPRERRLCNNAHFRFKGIRGADLVLRLSREGIAASTASACSAGSTEPSHVMTAIGLSPEDALSSLRISLSRYTTEEETEHLLRSLPKIVSDMRKGTK